MQKRHRWWCHYKKKEIRKLILKPISHQLDLGALHPSWLCCLLSSAAVSVTVCVEGQLSWKPLADIHGMEISLFLKNTCF